MRVFNFFNLSLVFVGSLTLASPFALASSPTAAPTRHGLKVHVLNNLDPSEAKLALKSLSRLGYQAVQSPLFTEASHAVVITKTIGTKLQTASVSFEILELKQNEVLPKTLFEIKESPSIESLMLKAPKPDQVRLMSPETGKPVATIN
ncbi:MAG: hypothetical protein KGP28_10760 [Bdellovibrionales bacterium]|nr:hypothetical protein [Bdellovibrionales bacterium]